MLSSHLLNKIITLETPIITVDASAGSKREIWEPVIGSENIAACIQPISSKAQHLFGSRQIVNTHNIYTKTDLKAKRGDRVNLPGTETYYIVTGFLNQAGRNKVFMVEGKEVTS